MTNTKDAAHQTAVNLSIIMSRDPLCTTQEVLTEYLNYFAEWGHPLRLKAVLNVQDILNDPGVRVIEQTADSFRSGLSLYRSRPDKGYSLTDCISMVTMRREGIDAVLTNDAHFEQEGFRAIFRE